MVFKADRWNNLAIDGQSGHEYVIDILRLFSQYRNEILRLFSYPYIIMLLIQNCAICNLLMRDMGWIKHTLDTGARSNKLQHTIWNVLSRRPLTYTNISVRLFHVATSDKSVHQSSADEEIVVKDHNDARWPTPTRHEPTSATVVGLVQISNF